MLETEIDTCIFCFSEDCNILKCRNDHPICKNCMIRGVENAIGDNKEFKCCDCLVVYPEYQLTKVLSFNLLKAYNNVVVFNNLKSIPKDNLFKCNNCEYAVFIDDYININYVYCENCRENYCIKCKKEEKLHIGNCQNNERESMGDFIVYCCFPMIRHDGCNKLTCTSCGKLWCWICKTQINGYDHFKKNKCALYGKDKTEIEIEREKTNDDLRKIQIQQLKRNHQQNRFNRFHEQGYQEIQIQLQRQQERYENLNFEEYIRQHNFPHLCVGRYKNGELCRYKKKNGMRTCWLHVNQVNQ